MNLESLDDKRLIESIIKEVMKKLEERIKENQSERPIKKDKILAIDMSDYKALHGEKHPYFIDFIDDYEGNIDINTYDFIILGSISHQDLVHISIGLANNTVTSIVNEAIMAGKKIYIVKEGRKYSQYENTANTNFYNMLKGYEEQLETFGIEWTNAYEIDRCIQGVYHLEEHHVPVKIITEALAKQYQKKGYKHLLIDKKTIVTPLAQDYLRDNKIKMITT